MTGSFSPKVRRQRSTRRVRRIVYTALILTLLESLSDLPLVVEANPRGQSPLPSTTEDGDVDSDEILRRILINYYNALERHKQHAPSKEEEVSPEIPETEEDEDEDEKEEDTLNLLEDSIGDSIMHYVKDHIKTRIWSGMFPDDQDTQGSTRKESSRKTHLKEGGRGGGRVHDYGDSGLWWEEEEGIHPRAGDPFRVEENPTRQMVNRIFTASGFALSLVVLVVFFLACTYCWCISSPSKMLGALSTVLAVILLLHRLHEFFLVFSIEDVKNVGEAFIGTNEPDGGMMYNLQ
jgi:hypothetical protein